MSTDRFCHSADGEATSSAANDCNDADPAIKPGATEIVGDGIDQNCDTSELCYADGDFDGYRGTGNVSSADLSCNDSGEAPSTADADCNDSDSSINGGSPEIPGDEIDQDCDGGELCYVDFDRDTYRSGTTTASADVSCTTANSEARATASVDCDDATATINPGASELAGDEIDQNCDGEELCYVDADSDGYRGTSTVVSSDLDCDPLMGESPASASADCNDGNAAINPGASEITGDEIDENCNGQEVCYVDSDQDGYRSTSTIVSADTFCNTGNGEAVSTATSDCYDLNPNAYPGQTGFFDAHRGDGSFDYNCDNTSEKYWTSTAVYSCRENITTCTWGNGWVGSVPGCGVTRDWGVDCGWIPFTGNCYPGTEYQRTQTCR